MVLSLFESRVETATSVWNNEFNRRGYDHASLKKGQGDIRIYVDKNAQGAYYDGPSKTLVFPHNYWQNSSDAHIIAAIAHELGHAFGFGQVSCPGESLMSDVTQQSYVTDFTPCDHANLTGFIGAPSRRDADHDGFSPDDWWDPETWDCDDYDPNVGNVCPADPGCGGGSCSPIIIDVARNGFRLTSVTEGVLFDLDGDGVPEQIAWTMPDSDDVWLALDRNGNGRIDNGRELFGNVTPMHLEGSGPLASNGFVALRFTESSSYGPCVPDGVIDASDSVYSRLLVWRDANHNGVSEPGELMPLASIGLVSIDTDYKESRRQDRHGNEFRQRAKARWVDGRSSFVYDVWLTRQH